jgi:hypothetical protein
MQNSSRSIFCICDIKMQNMQNNMSNNMQNMIKIITKKYVIPFSICRIAPGPYSAYSSFVFTPHYAEIYINLVCLNWSVIQQQPVPAHRPASRAKAETYMVHQSMYIEHHLYTACNDILNIMAYKMYQICIFTYVPGI